MLKAPTRDAGRLRIWSVVGLAAQAAFSSGWVIAQTWQGPGYSPITNTISDMQAYTAPHVWFLVTCFAVGGVGTFLFAVFGLRPALAGAGPTAAYAPWVLAFAALAIGNSFPQIPCALGDPGCTPSVQLQSPGGVVDATVASLAFLALAFTPRMLWPRLSVLGEWRRLRPVWKMARVVLPSCFLLLVASSDLGLAQGLAERLLATAVVLWIGALAANLALIAPPGRAGPVV